MQEMYNPGFATAVDYEGCEPSLSQALDPAPLNLAISAMRAAESDPFELVKAEELLRGYHFRWSEEPYEVLAVECEFTAPLVNPATGAESRTYVRGGKIDCMVRDETGDDVIVEHKTSAEDITAGSLYWQRLRMNSQIAGYLVGARALGYTPRKVLYDVIGKIGLRPKSATPEAERRYTKVTKAEPVARLYANQRETDETPEEYRQRVRETIAEDPSRFYSRGVVVRTEEDEKDSAADDWQQARLIREAELAGRYPRNPDSCLKYGQTCEYLDVCTRLRAIDDPVWYRKADGKHDELDGKARLPIVSNSEISTFRSCQRKHHYSYRLGYRPHQKSDALRFGTLIHLGLEAWWKAVQETQRGTVVAVADTEPAPAPGTDRRAAQIGF